MNAIGDYAKDLCGLALAAMMMAALLFRVRFHVLRTPGTRAAAEVATPVPDKVLEQARFNAVLR